MKQAIAELGLYPHEVMTISGIGCSSNLPGYINTYGMHTLHGRALAVATGAQLANTRLKIIVTGGDGDGYGIGGNHFVHTMRRNVDLTYIVMDNQIYGLTTGQVSPTSAKGMKTKSTPVGSVENPLNPIPLAIAAGATYVARGIHGPGEAPGRADQGRHSARGFALIDAFSPCVTFNLENTHEFFKQRTFKLEDKEHDPTDFAAAMEQVTSGAMRSRSVCSGNATICPRWTSSSRCWTKAARWRAARSEFLRSRQNRWSAS